MGGAVTDTPDTSPEALALFRALDQIDELNKLPPDEEGYRWDNSDLIAQEVVGARSALCDLLSQLQPYKDELLKIAESVGERDDPFAAWEAIEALSAALEVEKRHKRLIAGDKINAVSELRQVKAERDALKAKLAEAKMLLSHMVNHAEWREENEGVFWDATDQARAFLARHQKDADT